MGRFDGRGESREKGERKRLRLFCGVVAVPLAFLGLGVYRAWIEIVFVGSFVEFPAMAFSGRDVFDLTMVVTAVACTLLARRIGPFFNKPLVFAVCGVALTASTALMFASCWLPGIAPAAGLPAGVLGGFGIALLILFWSELYGCLNPLRVALYYSASIVAGALVFAGFHAVGKPAPVEAEGSATVRSATADAETAWARAFEEVCRAHDFSPRETEIISLYCQGRSAAAISEHMHLAEPTVRTYIRRAYAKLDVHNKQELFDIVGKGGSQA